MLSWNVKNAVAHICGVMEPRDVKTSITIVTSLGNLVCLVLD